MSGSSGRVRKRSHKGAAADENSRPKRRAKNGPTADNVPSGTPPQPENSTPASSSTVSLNPQQTADIVSAVITELSNRGLLASQANMNVNTNSAGVSETNSNTTASTVVNSNSASMAEVNKQNQDSASTAGVQKQNDLMSASIHTALGLQNLDPGVSGKSSIQPQGTPALTSLHSYSVVPSAFIEDKMKQSIWNDEFVEFYDLLYSKNTSNADVLLQFNTNGNSVSVSAPTKQSPKQLSIGQWLSAFHVFLDIYTSKHPDSLSGLLSYCSLVRDLERAYGAAAFHYYDRTFRAHRQHQPLNWGCMHTELWIKATTLTANSSSNRSLTSTKQKTCNNFSKAQGCPFKNCRFAHICEHCFKKHPKYNCFQLQKQHNAAAAPSGPSGSLSSNKAPQSFRGQNANSGRK